MDASIMHAPAIFGFTRPAHVRRYTASTLLVCLMTLLKPLSALAWGEQGHRIVGVDALELTGDTARETIVEILGGDSGELVGEACNWPDTVRKTPAWEWSAKLHYVNIPRSDSHYEPERDCDDGGCVTEAIVKYANELGHPELGAERRWQAFAFLCHFVGDLHQPLHAGYVDDLGGNLVEIEYRGHSDNLHQFWDRMVIRDRLGANEHWEKPFPGPYWTGAEKFWNPESVRWWTDESHALVARSAYPDDRVVSEAFADASWLIIRQQWQKASNRLARILNATVGDGEVITR